MAAHSSTRETWPAEKRGTRWLTPTEAADRLGRSPKWLRELVKQGMPREPGRAGRYPWPAIREWHDRYLEQKIVAKLQPASWKDERAAYTRTRRKMAELDLRKREGELVEIETARVVVGEMLDKLRHGLLNIPGTWSPDLIALGATRLCPLEPAVRRRWVFPLFHRLMAVPCFRVGSRPM